MSSYLSATRPVHFRQPVLSGISSLLLIGAFVACSAEPQGITFDQNGDGIGDHLGTPFDLNKDGVIDGQDVVDVTGDGVPDGPGFDQDGNGVPECAAVDADGDGALDTLIGTTCSGTPATGGSTGVGGSTTGSGGWTQGSGGSTPGAGGTILPGSGGVVGSGGQGSGGAGPGSGGGGAVGSGGANVGSCDITISSAKVADRMRTVGLVDFTTDAAGSSATVEFGLDTTYGMTATAEAKDGGYSAMLLGMKANSTYHFRVVVGDCAGPDQTLESGPVASGIQGPTQKSTGPDAAPGFIIVAASFQALILDKDGDVVWGMDMGDELAGSFVGMTSARLSWDGKYMYARDLGPFDAGTGGKLVRVPLDASTGPETLPLAGGHHHDFTVIPDGIAYIAKQQGGQCDHIFTANADGSDSKSLVDLAVIFGQYPQGGFGTEACHVNAINYYPSRKLYSVSDREKDVIAVFDETGTPVMAIGQNPSGTLPITPIIAEGATTTWRVQHGHDLYADDKLAVFSNHAMGSQQSPVLHYTITGAQASLDWQYTDVPASGTQGDVDHLPNGNFLVTSSMGGEIHEISPTQQVIGRYKFQGGIGYVNHRTTLYGPPGDD